MAAARMAERAGAGIADLRISTRIEMETQELLRRQNVEPREPTVAPKLAPGRLAEVGQEQVALQTNIHSMNLESGERVYLYDMMIVGIRHRQDGRRNEEWITKKTKEDLLAQLRKDKARHVFKKMLEVCGAFLINPHAVFYDLQSLLYSMNRLELDGDVHTLRLESQHIPAEWKFDYVQIKIREANPEDFRLNLGDLHAFLDDNLEEKDVTLKTFLEIATSQFPLMEREHFLCFGNGRSYLLAPEDYGFTKDDLPMLSADVYLGVGAHKSVRCIEGPGGAGNASVAMVVETKKSPFYAVLPVLNVARMVIQDLEHASDADLRKLTERFKGLFVVATHTNATHKIKLVCKETARTHSFPGREGQPTTMNDYFKHKYKKEIRHQDVPLMQLEGRRPGDIIHLPMEFLEIADDQRVDTRHQTPAMLQKMIKAMPPAVRIEQNRRNVQALRFGDERLVENGIHINARPMKVNGRILPAPQLTFGNKNVSPDPSKGCKWDTRSVKYLQPATVSYWGVIFVSAGLSDRLSEGEVMQFVDRFVQECRQRGMKVPDPCFRSTCPADLDHFDEVMKGVRGQRLQYCLIIHTDHDTHIHDAMKRYEPLFHMVTQGVRVKTVLDVVRNGKPQTMENIVNKTNVKLGGLNYTLNMTDPKAKYMLSNDILFIGFGAEHPGGQPARTDEERSDGPPSIYAANTNKHPFEFVGDFKFQESRRDEKTKIIVKIITTCIENFLRNRRERPKHVIIYRNGCSEGQFANIIKYEVPLIYAALRKQNCLADVVLLVPNKKQQDVRLFQERVNSQDKPPAQNIKPGTVVDTHIVHPRVTEFYLNSHVALQGSAKTPRYTVLVNDPEFSLDKLQAMTYWLCYGHQIVGMPTSLPSPVYIALEYAKRGREIYNAHVARSSSSSGSGSQTGNSSDDPGSSNGGGRTRDLDYMSEIYSYTRCPLANKRVNA
ncbi:WAGO-2 protein [Aphelenchoides avenae]|nr:WAGO-2 protein [Aphelenchus avenae]